MSCEEDIYKLKKYPDNIFFLTGLNLKIKTFAYTNPHFAKVNFTGKSCAGRKKMSEHIIDYGL